MFRHSSSWLKTGYIITLCFADVFRNSLDLFYSPAMHMNVHHYTVPSKSSATMLTLSPLAVNFEDRWWPMQTIWIQMKLHKMWGFIWDPNCLTFRLYISKIFMRKQWFFASFERKKYLKKLPSMQRVKLTNPRYLPQWTHNMLYNDFLQPMNLFFRVQCVIILRW